MDTFDNVCESPLRCIAILVKTKKTDQILGGSLAGGECGLQFQSVLI